MKPSALACLLLLATGGAFAQPSEFRDARLARIDDPLRVEFQRVGAALDPAKLGQAIASAAQATGWRILAQDAGRITLTRTVGDRHTMRVELGYNASGYTLRYIDSLNLLYQEDALTMGGAKARGIHKNYNLWIRQLASAINSSLGLPASAYAAPTTPLPIAVRIEAPGPDVPAAIAGYSGVWVGKWGGRLEHTLVVEKIEGDEAVFIYSFNPAQFSNASGPGWRRVHGTIDSRGVLRGTMGRNADTTAVSYKFSADGNSLIGEYYRRGRVTAGTFRRGELPAQGEDALASPTTASMESAAIAAPAVEAQYAPPGRTSLGAPSRPEAARRNIVLDLSGTSAAMNSADWDRLTAEWHKAMRISASNAGADFSVRLGATPISAPGTLVAVHVNRFRFVAPGARIVLGVMTGNASMDVTVTLSDLATGTLLNTRTYKTTSRGKEGIFSAVTDKQVQAVADQITTDVAAMGAKYGKAP